ncbi:MAG: EamA family transporter [candidate division Zixibacteria bacterium HGW-Zixibacteria-1]|nr:MAG: EamA family transporter [candidate division Zixibacteria bacterium HGW-Zixibacteria-1]
MVKQGTIYATLFVATFAVSWAAILIKLSGAGPLPTAFYRMAIASIILAVPAFPALRRAMKTLTGRQKILLLTSGVVLGLHFAVWVTSLFYTTISNSAILVATQPVWVLILEASLLKERIPSRSIIGMLIALVGIIIISGADFDMGRDYIIGDLLALAGAVFAALYLFIGRKLRANLDNLGYIFPVYSIAAITLVIIALFYHVNLTDYPARTWFIFFLLALIPTVVGHSLYNWLLKFVQAHIVATTVLGEPIGATVLAIFFFDQIPGWWTLIGGILILSGIFVVLKRRKKDKIIIPE